MDIIAFAKAGVVYSVITSVYIDISTRKALKGEPSKEYIDYIKLVINFTMIISTISTAILIAELIAML